MEFHFTPDSVCVTNAGSQMENENQIFLSSATDAAHRRGLMTQTRQLLPNEASILDHLDLKRNQTMLLKYLAQISRC